MLRCTMKWISLFAVISPFWGGSTVSAKGLIITIGNYNGSAYLPGVKNDKSSGNELANAFGVKTNDLIFLSDDAASLEGIRKAFAQLNTTANANEEIFIYYSGHGTRYVKGDRCAEGLITKSEEVLEDTELEWLLNNLATKSSKLTVVLDACYSGGATSAETGRAIVDENRMTMRMKSFTPKEAIACFTPTNVLSRSINAKTTPSPKALNFTYIAAAQNDQVAWDTNNGGLATVAMKNCANLNSDKDLSGAVTVQELVDCAQARMNKFNYGQKGHASTIAIAGLRTRTLPFQPASVTSTTALANVAGDSSVSINSTPDSELDSQKMMPPARTLMDIYNDRDRRRNVQLKPLAGIVQQDATTIRINQEPLLLSLTSTHGGYVYLLMAGSEGKTFDLLFPNAKDRENFINAEQFLQLPRNGIAFMPAGPAGRNLLLAVVSETPLNLSALGQDVGPFSLLTANKPADRTLVIQETAHSSNCVNVAGKARCANIYGAALLTVVEQD